MKQLNSQKIHEKLANPFWRLNNLYFIKDSQGKRVKFKFNPPQAAFYPEIHYQNLILKARQLGFSTLISILMLDRCLFHANQKCGVIDISLPDAKKKLAKVKFAYDNLPDEIKEARPMVKRGAEEIEFSNGSGVVVGTSHRGDTLQILHISEFGKIAAQTPEKAKEIITGALNAVHAGQMVFIESTAEGKSGAFYEMCQEAQRLQQSGRDLTPMDMKFFFFPWYKNPNYTLDAEIVIPQDLQVYLDRLPVDLTQGQCNWYALKEKSQGAEMRREFPSDPKEAFEGSAEGAFYTKEMARLRESGQIQHVAYNQLHPVSTFWDLGKSSDLMSIWFMQFVKGKICVIDYHESSGLGWDFYANMLSDKGYRYGKHYFPHDGNTRQVGKDVQTAKDIASEAGIRPIQVIPRTKSVWADIMGHCRVVLPQCWFDESKCDAGIAHLDNYTRKFDRVNAMWLNEAHHDKASHGADSFRTFAVWYSKYREQDDDEDELIDPLSLLGRGGYGG